MINIHARVKHLIQKYETRDPEEIANILNITIIKKRFNSTRTKGFYKKASGKKFIVVNSLLDEFSQKIVIAHELGHALLHSSKLTQYIREYTLFPRGKVEIEANRFAAELLIDEKEIDKLYLKELCLNQLANYYGVPVQLIEYKFNKKIQ